MTTGQVSVRYFVNNVDEAIEFHPRQLGFEDLAGGLAKPSEAYPAMMKDAELPRADEVRRPSEDPRGVQVFRTLQRRHPMARILPGSRDFH